MRPGDSETEDAVRPRAGAPKLSAMLDQIARDESRERVSIADLLAIMGDRAFGALMLVFAAPNILPTPPGTSAILGAPLVLLSLQVMLRQKAWLPRIISARSMTREDFAEIVARILPWLHRAEGLLKPRLQVLARPPAEQVVGFVCLVLALILALPIPLGNILPALAISMFSLGILERDGVWILIGAATTVVSLTVVAGVIYGLALAIAYFVTRIFA
jgi:Uncharacterized ABC-type transport system, permease components